MKPRVGLVLVWLLPTSEDETEAALADLSPEEIAAYEEQSGMDIRRMLSRLQDLALDYRQDRRELRAKLLELLDGNEIAAEEVLQFFASLWQNKTSAKQPPQEKPGDVIPFEHGEKNEEEKHEDDPDENDDGEEEEEDDDEGGDA